MKRLPPAKNKAVEGIKDLRDMIGEICVVERGCQQGDGFPPKPLAPNIPKREQRGFDFGGSIWVTTQ